MKLLVTLAVGLATASAPAGASGLYGSGFFQLGDGQVPAGFAGAARIVSDGGQAGPDWSDLFDAAGEPIADLQARYGGSWAVFIADDVSRNIVADGTALAGSPGLVRVTGVRSADDIGNAYGYGAAGAKIFLGVERLNALDSFVEFELNQQRARLGRGGYGQGLPWEVDGPHSVGDLLVRVDFLGGVVVSADVSAWSQGAWHAVAHLDGEGCDEGENFCAVANAGSVAGGPWQNFDAVGDTDEIGENRFLELGVDAGTLLGGGPAFRGLRVRTPEDIAFGFTWEGN